MDCLISSMATEEVLLPLGMFADIEHGLGTPLGSQELEITVGAAPDASMHPEEPGSAGDEGNDIDDDDDVPLLALRANGAAPNGLLSADGDGDGEDGLTSSGRKRKPAADKEVISPPAKRQNKFKPVKATERCGHCRTCLNPHLKKACETVRSRMGTGVGSTSARSSSPPSPSATTKPLPYTAPSAAIKREPSAASAAAQQSTRQVSGAEAGPGPRSSTSAASAAAAPGSGAVVPPAAACEPSMDAVVKEVTDMVTRNGGVQDVRYVERLAHILSSEDRMSMRLTLMAVLSASSQEVLSKLLHDAQGLRIFETWVAEFRDAEQPRINHLRELIQCLRMMPMDVNLLKASGIGAAIGKLRKHENAGLRTEATALVDAWKKLVDAAKDKGEAVAPLKKRAEAATGDPAAKKAKKALAKLDVASASASPAGKASPKESAAAGVIGSASSTLLGSSNGHVVAGSDGAAAAGGTAGGLQALDDDALLQAPEKVQHSVRTAVQTVKKVHTLQRLANPTAKLGAKLGPAGASGTDGTQDSAYGDAVADGAVEGAEGKAAGAGSGSSSSSSSLAATGGVGTLGPSKSTGMLGRLGTLGSGRLGSLRDGSLPGAPVARLGSLGTGRGGPMFVQQAAAVAPGGPQSAASRAAAARARAPSPEPGPRKEKLKSVSWVGETTLVAVRWFRKEDAPVAAKADVLSSDDSLPETVSGSLESASLPVSGTQVAAAAAQPHAGFESAARREHMAERLALQAQHDAEAQERSVFETRLSQMVPSLPWLEPPFMPLEPAWKVALGEDSESCKAYLQHKATRAQQVLYSHPSQVPPSPAEPPHEVPSEVAALRVIPLRVLPGAASQASMQQAMPAGGMHGMGPGLHGPSGQGAQPGILHPGQQGMPGPGSGPIPGPGAQNGPHLGGYNGPPQGPMGVPGQGQGQAGPRTAPLGPGQGPPPPQQAASGPGMPHVGGPGPEPASAAALPADLLASLPGILSSLSAQPAGHSGPGQGAGGPPGPGPGGPPSVPPPHAPHPSAPSHPHPHPHPPPHMPPPGPMGRPPGPGHGPGGPMGHGPLGPGGQPGPMGPGGPGQGHMHSRPPMHGPMPNAPMGPMHPPMGPAPPGPPNRPPPPMFGPGPGPGAAGPPRGVIMGPGPNGGPAGGGLMRPWPQVPSEGHMGPGGPGPGPMHMHMQGPPSSGGRPNSAVPCKFFNMPNGCRLGDACRFLHVREPEGAGPPRMGGPGGPQPPAQPRRR